MKENAIAAADQKSVSAIRMEIFAFNFGSSVLNLEM